MPTRRRPPPTTALDALSGAEHTRILAELLHSHPELRSEAEDAARRLLDDASVDAIAESVASALEEPPLDALAMRSGRIRGRGYVHETEAAGKSSKKRSSLFSPTCGGAPSWAWVPLWTSRQE
jgi:hypothetical protein